MQLDNIPKNKIIIISTLTVSYLIIFKALNYAMQFFGQVVNILYGKTKDLIRTEALYFEIT